MLQAVNAYVRDGFLPETALGRGGRRETDDRLLALVAAIRGAEGEITLQAICTWLDVMRERDPSAGRTGSPRRSGPSWNGRRDGVSRLMQGQAKGFTIRNRSSTRRPFAMSSLHSVVQPAISALATIIAS